MIRAVIFDYGNVISLTQDGSSAREMEKRSGVPASIFASVYDKFRCEFDLGYINGAEMYAMLLEKDGYPELAKNTALMREFADIDLESWRAYDERVVEWGLALQARGFKLGILSNMPFEFLDRYESEIPLFVAADYACYSCRVRLIKPDEAIYANAISGLGIKPDEAVFFDDMQENIDAANRFGIHGIRWQGVEQAQTDLERLLKISASR